MKKLCTIYFLLITLVIYSIQFLAGCKTDTSTSSTGEDGLPAYEGATTLSNITVQPGSFKPAITWIGGYVSVVGINRGTRAALDTSLVWLIYAPANSIHYPVSFGSLPQGTTDLTTTYGGKPVDSLSEDNVYTYWVLKEDAWSQITTAKGKTLIVDSTLSTTVNNSSSDSVRISPFSLGKRNVPIDVFVNINDVNVFGRLGEITVRQPRTNPKIVVSWTITQPDVTDSLISAMGVTEGSSYSPTGIMWEIWSQDSTGGSIPVYGKSNIIRSPITIGQSVAGTKVFTAFPASGLTRGKTYYVWIANKSWDATNRIRSTPYYAYATFHVY